MALREMETQPASREQSGRSLTRKLLGFISKRKRDEEKRRMDLCRAMRDSSVERLATVIASARRDYGDQLHDLCVDAERVLQQLLRENRPPGSHKVTLRERLLLADIEANQPAQVLPAPPQVPTADNCSSSSEPQLASSSAPRLQALLTLMRPSGEVQAGTNTAATTTGGSSTSLVTQESSSGSTQPGSSSRRLLSALLWEERNLDDPDRGWVAFGVSVEAPVHFDHSRSQSVNSELSRAAHACHRPSSSLSSAMVGATGSSSQNTSTTPAAAVADTVTSTSGSNVSATPMRVSLMSLLREAEDGGGIIFMNRQVLDRGLSCESPSRDSAAGAETDQTCCVCMGRRKGAAFIPCGHTFCRTCCRELQTARGTCPLCNQEIKDILNLY